LAFYAILSLSNCKKAILAAQEQFQQTKVAMQEQPVA
jgi:hypothetical protein